MRRVQHDTGMTRFLIVDCDGVLTDGRVWVDANGNESVAYSKRDSRALNRLREELPGAFDVVFITREPRVGYHLMRAAKLGVLFSPDETRSRLDHVTELAGGDLSRVVLVVDSDSDFEAADAVLSAGGVVFAPVDAHRALKHALVVRAGGTGVLEDVVSVLISSVKGS